MGLFGSACTVRPIGIRWIAAGERRSRALQRRNSTYGIELWQSIERLVRNAVCCPVGPHISEIVIQRAILLGKNNDVIQAL